MFSLRFSKIANRSNSMHNSILQPHENVKKLNSTFIHRTHIHTRTTLCEITMRARYECTGTF